MPRRLALAAGVMSIGLALTLAPDAASAVQPAQAGRTLPASLKSPTPPKTGTWKFHDSQDVTSGSLVVYKKHGHLKIKHMHGVLNSFNATSGCEAGPFTVKGTLAIHKTKVSKSQDAWAVSKGWGSQIGPGFKPVKVTVTYGGKTVHAKLQVVFADPHYKPVTNTYSFGNVADFNTFAGADCNIDFGLKHK
jgi:hypothetical protein